MKTAGYSGTPLVQKLGIKSGFRVAFLNEPSSFRRTLGLLPENLTIFSKPRKALDLVVLFVRSQKELTGTFSRCARCLAPTGMLWVAWPKKSSGVPSDLDENVVRRIGLDAGLVDVKVCAIDETWSGLKFVIRLKDRVSTARITSAK